MTNLNENIRKLEELLEEAHQQLWDADYQRASIMPNFERMIRKIEDFE